MSAEARTLELIADAVARETQPLKARLDELSARLAALEGAGGTTDAEPQKRPTAGRTAARGKAPQQNDDAAGSQRKGGGE
jgi:hypothetical protein